MVPTRRTLLYGAAALAVAPPAMAQTGNWPVRPLRIIIPTAPGGSPDTVARTLGNKLTERFGQPVIVESISQGVGILGNQMVSKSAPDGYTLAMLTGGFTTQAAVMKSLPYDPIRDFAFVTSVVAYPMFLLVAPNSPIASFKESDRSGARRARQSDVRHHRRRQRLSLARKMDREPRRRRDDSGAVSRVGACLHRPDRRPA